MTKKIFTTDEAKEVAHKIGIVWDNVDFEVEDFTMGMNVELEHGNCDPMTNVTDDDPVITCKIALAHLNEFGDYYVRLDKMEKEAEGKI
ncbi:hypothetical protein K8R61_01550 [bacterium]|nr:hypothetical protein [bacterium]